MLGALVYYNVIVVVNVKILLIESRHWTWLHGAALLASLAVWWVFELVYPSLWGKLPLGEEVYGMHTVSVRTTPQTVLIQLLVVAAALAPDIATSRTLWMSRSFDMKFQPRVGGQEGEEEFELEAVPPGKLVESREVAYRERHNVAWWQLWESRTGVWRHPP
ncbi:hypothetical protein DFJ73DRAFT_826368 [Zopfochytrium polystomum]|nr:hypothetical protein DFJ73DRAFT_826368 [Zopfochytrium polystomum]